MKCTSARWTLRTDRPRLSRIMVVVWVLSVCKRSGADDDQHGSRVDSASGNHSCLHRLPSISYELMLAEAEDVANMAGAAFSGLSYDHVSQEVDLLACIGDPDVIDIINVCEKNENDQCKLPADAMCSAPRASLPYPVHFLVEQVSGPHGNGGFPFGIWLGTSCQDKHPAFAKFAWAIGRKGAASCSPYVAMLAWHVLETAGHMLIAGGQHTQPVRDQDGSKNVFSEMCFGPLIASAAFAVACGTLLPDENASQQLVVETESNSQEVVVERETNVTLSSMHHTKRKGGGTTGDTHTKILNMLALLSVAWNILKLEDDMPFPNHYAVTLKMVVAEVDRWMTAHGDAARHRSSYLQQLIPVRYPLEALPQGQYAKEVPHLEQIEVDMNNILAAQYGRFNPVGYRILPSFESVHTEIMAGHSRRVLIDCGAGAFADGSKLLLDMYSVRAPFTEALLIDPREYSGEDRRKMHAYQAKHGVNITTRNVALRVGSRDACSDVLSMLDDLRLSRADFVVLKFDCDSPESDAFSLEWGFLADLVTSQRHLDLVDEIYVELHFFYPYMFGSSFRHRSLWQALDLMRQLRAAGIAIHAWP